VGDDMNRFILVVIQSLLISVSCASSRDLLSDDTSGEYDPIIITDDFPSSLRYIAIYIGSNHDTIYDTLMVSITPVNPDTLKWFDEVIGDDILVSKCIKVCGFDMPIPFDLPVNILGYDGIYWETNTGLWSYTSINDSIMPLLMKPQMLLPREPGLLLEWIPYSDGIYMISDIYIVPDKYVDRYDYEVDNYTYVRTYIRERVK